jgi:hypothetical protein
MTIDLEKYKGKYVLVHTDFGLNPFYLGKLKSYDSETIVLSPGVNAANAGKSLDDGWMNPLFNSLSEKKEDAEIVLKIKSFTIREIKETKLKKGLEADIESV